MSHGDLTIKRFCTLHINANDIFTDTSCRYCSIACSIAISFLIIFIFSSRSIEKMRKIELRSSISLFVSITEVNVITLFPERVITTPYHQWDIVFLLLLCYGTIWDGYASQHLYLNIFLTNNIKKTYTRLISIQSVTRLLRSIFLILVNVLFSPFAS